MSKEKLVNMWKWAVCEYQVHRSIHPPTYPKTMQRVLAHHLGMELESVKCLIHDFEDGTVDKYLKDES